MTMIVFDTETTGLLRPEATELHLQPYIIEIYCAKLNDKLEIIDEFDTLIKPPVPVSEEITKITGISNDMLENKKPFIVHYDALCEFFLGSYSLAAHNCTFDTSMLQNELLRIDCANKFPWPKNHICTIEKSFDLKNKRLKLSDLYRMATGKEMLNAHRAKNDVLPMIECIKFLKEEGLI